MRILVTGGAGYIGSHAVRWFQKRGHDVWVFDNLSAGHAAAIFDTPLIVGDLLDEAALDRAFQASRCDAVAHFAGRIDVGESIAAPLEYYRANVAGTLSLVERMKRHGVRRLVAASTCAAEPAPGAIGEAPSTPASPYGRTKLSAEWLLDDCARAYGLGVVQLRFYNAAGASPEGGLGEDHRPERHLIPLTLQVAAGRRESLGLFGTDHSTPDGTCIRDYVHVDDLAEAFLVALETVEPGEICGCSLGTGKGSSVREVVRLCEQVTGRSIALRARPRRAGDTAVLVADPRLAIDRLGWHPRYEGLREIIATAWNWHRTHPSGYDEADAVIPAEKP